MAACTTCLDTGWIEVDGCTCEASDPGVSGVSHEPMCGTEPCPEGCGDSGGLA
jgi:hypothetical protein